MRKKAITRASSAAGRMFVNQAESEGQLSNLFDLLKRPKYFAEGTADVESMSGKGVLRIILNSR